MHQNQHKVLFLSILLYLFLIIGTAPSTFAQSKAKTNAALREKIELKRNGSDPADKNAMTNAKEFIRIDSTYYVGWYYEGFYKYLHAEDYRGYHNAIAPLERALYLLERDYATELRTRSSDLLVYYPVYNYQVTYSRIGAALRECYANCDMPDKVVQLMRRTIHWKFQRDYYLDPYNYLAWISHRYRSFNTKQYSFLAGTIDQNEQQAMRYLDTALYTISKNERYNQNIFRPGYVWQDRLGVYHYKCILFSYNFMIDSAQFYYDIMKDQGALPHNNYANFKSICGDFETAEKEYRKAATIESGDKRLQEWVYFLSILQTAKAQPKEALELCKEQIKINGSSPGYGWYQIALARAYSYAGQLKAAQKALKKAENFKELHIGTTLGQSQYDFSIQLQKLIQLEQSIAQIKFEQTNWWYQSKSLSLLAQYQAEKLMLQYFISNQLAQNPERERVIYTLFSTENTVCWDEIWPLIKDFSSNYFIKKWEQQVKKDPRKAIHKYFKLFIAKLYIKQEKYQQTKTLLTNILKDPMLNRSYEQLFIARCYEALADLAHQEDKELERSQYTLKLYDTYPQLIPFGAHKMACLGHFGTNTQELKEALAHYNLQWLTAKEKATKAHLQLFVEIQKTKEKSIAIIKIIKPNGQILTTNEKIHFTKIPELAKTIAYKLYQIDVNG